MIKCVKIIGILIFANIPQVKSGTFRSKEYPRSSGVSPHLVKG